MKTKLLILLLIILSTKIYSQENKFRDSINIHVDSLIEPPWYYGGWQLPLFPGGESELMNYIKKEFNYPQSAKNDSIQGKVLVNFEISNKGEVINANIIKGLSEDINKEVLRVILKMPCWTPGIENGQPAGGRFALPITFNIDEFNKNKSR